MQQLLRILSLTALLIAAPLHAQTDDGTGPPERGVERLETMLLEHMKAGGAMTFERRYERLRPLLGEILALERMGRYVFGRDWPSFAEAQRARFTEAFGDLSAATYAARFVEYNGERFDAVDVERQGEDRAVVRRRLTTGSGKRVAFDYLMTRDDGAWRIVTIITDGVSDLALKRSQYRRILDDRGFGAVLEHIDNAIDSQRDGD